MSSCRARTKKEAEILSSEQGLVAFFPERYELLLDLDEPFETAVIKMQSRISNKDKVIGTIASLADVRIRSTFYTTSVSGNAHLYLRMNRDIEPIERIVIQACIGSDPTREVYNYYRYAHNNKEERNYTVCLFETPEQASLVLKWRREVLINSLKRRIKP